MASFTHRLLQLERDENIPGRQELKRDPASPENKL